MAARTAGAALGRLDEVADSAHLWEIQFVVVQFKTEIAVRFP
ncbi:MULTISPECIES: hypothetical protein [Mesorhizobium]|nr:MULTISPECIES: hypothetical protein [Mesorhizobium]